MPASSQHALLGQSMPRFQRPALEHELVDTTRLRGKPLVLEFFASYCEPCKRTLPAVVRLHGKYPGVQVVGVCEDESRTIAVGLAQTYGLTFPVVMDPSRALLGRYRVHEMPITFVADSSGVIRWVGGPEQTEAELDAAIAAVVVE